MTAPTPVSTPQAISEADIFIAYGRYDQARELLEADPELRAHSALRQALEQQRQRQVEAARLN
mgnify:CR=1 FL=1